MKQTLAAWMTLACTALLIVELIWGKMGDIIGNMINAVIGVAGGG